MMQEWSCIMTLTKQNSTRAQTVVIRNRYKRELRQGQNTSVGVQHVMLQRSKFALGTDKTGIAGC